MTKTLLASTILGLTVSLIGCGGSVGGSFPGDPGDTEGTLNSLPAGGNSSSNQRSTKGRPPDGSGGSSGLVISANPGGAAGDAGASSSGAPGNGAGSAATPPCCKQLTPNCGSSNCDLSNEYCAEATSNGQAVYSCQPLSTKQAPPNCGANLNCDFATQYCATASAKNRQRFVSAATKAMN